jgi:hypothetical protein
MLTGIGVDWKLRFTVGNCTGDGQLDVYTGVEPTIILLGIIGGEVHGEAMNCTAGEGVAEMEDELDSVGDMASGTLCTTGIDGNVDISCCDAGGGDGELSG